MYVGRKYTATKTVHLRTDFTCARCRHHCEVDVIGVGQGAGNSAYFLDDSGAAERAQQSAQKAAGDNAELTLGLAPCPRCGHQNGLATFWTHNVLGALAILAGFFGFGALFDSLKRGDGIGLWIFGGVSLFVLAVVGYMRWINLSSAPRRVFFHEAEPEERPKRKRKKKARPAESESEVDVAP